MPDIKLYLSPSHDPSHNLATEEYLRAHSGDDYLFLYINDPCVVVGRNQCPEAEADLGFCRRNGIRVLRRISGGGTVYHDRGNLNYSFIRSGQSVLASGREDLTAVVTILREMGVPVTEGPRNQLLLDGLKVSGTASFSRGGRYIFHGTLLYDSDIQTLNRSLRGDPTQRGKNIASVPSEVTNLRERLPGIGDLSGFVEGLIETACNKLNYNLVHSIPPFETGNYITETIV